LLGPFFIRQSALCLPFHSWLGYKLQNVTQV
jgi:hypothetical protein